MPMPNEAAEREPWREAMHNLIALARPHFSDASEMLALHEAEKALAAPSTSEAELRRERDELRAERDQWDRRVMYDELAVREYENRATQQRHIDEQTARAEVAESRLASATAQQAASEVEIEWLREALERERSCSVGDWASQRENDALTIKFYEMQDRARAAESQLTEATAPHSVIAEIAAERRRQVEEEGWTAEHDDGHDDSQIALAAACYALPEWQRKHIKVDAPAARHRKALAARLWPWSLTWWKPKGPRRDLIRAAALIVAEIERLDRAALLERGV